MCFARVPPEINSGRLFEGSGSESLARAARAWNELAATLRKTAACYEALTVSFATGWPGVITAAIGRVLAPYVAWLNVCAAHAAQTATQAAAAASAHDTAVSAVVPPEVIACNRIRLASLAATNYLAQACPAVAQIEHEYHRMWVEDAEAMYAYARASAKASVLTPFTSAVSAIEQQDSTDVNARRRARRVAAAPRAITAGRQVIEALPEALQAISTSGQGTLDTHLLAVTPALSTLCSSAAPPDVALQRLQATNRGLMVLRAAALAATRGERTASVFGIAHSIGPLSVPALWSTRASSDPVEGGFHTWAWEPLRLVRGNVHADRSVR